MFLKLDWGIIWPIVNIVVFYLLLRKFLFGPVSEVMEKRKKMISSDLDDAAQTKAEAEEIKQEYEKNLAQAKDEAGQIVSDARTRAKNEYQNKMDQTKEEIADFYLNEGVKKVVIKLGTSGSYSKERLDDGSFVESEETCFKVPVVDTVGAGDGFASGVISATLEGLDDKKILERGNAIGAMQVMNLSDNEGLPTINGLNEFLKTYQKKN